MQKLILSLRRILHVWNWFRTDEAKEDYNCRGKPREGKITIKTKIKKNNGLDIEIL